MDEGNGNDRKSKKSKQRKNQNRLKELAIRNNGRNRRTESCCAVVFKAHF